MTFKIVGTDVDGTLLTSDGELSTGSASTLRGLVQGSVPVVLLSGRTIKKVLAVLDILSFDCCFVCLNGAMVCRKKGPDVDIIKRFPISIKEAEFVLDFIKEEDCASLLYTDDGIFSTASCPKETRLVDNYVHVDLEDVDFTTEESILKRKERLKKIVLIYRELTATDYRRVASLLSKRLHVIRDGDAVELLEKGVNKGKAFSWLIGRLNIRPAETLCFGDGQNDVELLQCAGLGVAVRNASPICLEASDKVSPYTNDEDCIHKEIKKLVRKRKFNLDAHDAF